MNKQDYQKYLKSDHFADLRQMVYNYRKGKCQECDKRRGLDIHHRHYLTLWKENYKRDLQLLCRKHHYRKHFWKWLKSRKPSDFFDWLYATYSVKKTVG